MVSSDKKFKISGVDHIGLGVKNLDVMRSYYYDLLEFNHIFAEFPLREHKPLEVLLRMPHIVFSAVILQQEAGGVLIEFVEMVNPVPRPIQKHPAFGDIGVNKITIIVPDVDRFYERYRSKLDFLSGPRSASIPEWGIYNFVYCKDPEGNLIEFASTEKVHVENNYGGVYSVGISVTDLDRSLDFYQRVLGFKEIVKRHDSLSGLVDEVCGYKNTEVRSCLLSNGDKGGKVELFEVLTPRGRSMPFSANWGDFGYLQLCLNAKSVGEIAGYFKAEGIEIVSPPMNADDEVAPAFMYFRDPDGIFLEVMDFSP
jgi:catechol 2,3-dioxygenase-like lactoylglutathione lyase family enzyme